MEQHLWYLLRLSGLRVLNEYVQRSGFVSRRLVDILHGMAFVNISKGYEKGQRELFDVSTNVEGIHVTFSRRGQIGSHLIWRQER